VKHWFDDIDGAVAQYGLGKVINDLEEKLADLKLGVKQDGSTKAVSSSD